MSFRAWPGILDSGLDSRLGGNDAFV